MEHAATIGDNSRHFGEQIEATPPVCTVLDDDYKKLFYYAKWHIGDYITGTQGMTPEQEGIYMRFLMRLYDRGKPFPDDDRFMVMVMGLSTVRVWKRFKDSLVAIGKIICRNGCLTNGRFEKERLTRASELKKQADSARKRWANEREKKKVSPKLQPNLDETSPKLSANIDEKDNENNEIPVTPHMPPRDERLEKKEEKEERKQDSDPDGSGGEPPEASLRELVWTKCISWLLPRSCLDEARLRARVGRWVQEFGAGAVIDAVAIAQKEAPVSIMAYVEGVLRRKAQSPQQPVDWKKRREDDDFVRKMAGIQGVTVDEYRRQLAADGITL